MDFEIGDGFFGNSLQECFTNGEIVEPTIVVLPPNKSLAFKSVVHCGFPGFHEICAVIIQVEAIVNIVLPDGRVTVDTVGGVICGSASEFFWIIYSWRRVCRRVHPELVFVVVVRIVGNCRPIVVKFGSWVGGVRGGRRRGRPMRHGVGVGRCVFFVLVGVTDRQVCVEFRFWNCVVIK